MRCTITDLYYYPLKSAKGISVTEATIGSAGFTHDREWMLINKSDRFLSQRQIPQMALLKAEVNNGELSVSYPGKGNIRVADRNRETLEVTMHRQDELIQVVSCGDAAAQWFSDVFDKDIRLVKIDPAFQRKIPDLQSEEVKLADGFPYLVTSHASLAVVNDRLLEHDPMREPITMERFRSNIVLDLETPWAEMESNLALRSLDGKVCFRLAKPCQRCGIPQLDPTSGERDTGAELHKILKDLCNGPVNCFGQNAIPETGVGRTLKTGMEMELVNVDS